MNQKENKERKKKGFKKMRKTTKLYHKVNSELEKLTPKYNPEDDDVMESLSDSLSDIFDPLCDDKHEKTLYCMDDFIRKIDCYLDIGCFSQEQLIPLLDSFSELKNEVLMIQKSKIEQSMTEEERILFNSGKSIKDIILLYFNEVKKPLSEIEEIIAKRDLQSSTFFSNVLEEIRVAVDKEDYNGILDGIDEISEAIQELLFNQILPNEIATDALIQMDNLKRIVKISKRIQLFNKKTCTIT